jgi:hypothetical protein
VVGEKIQAFLTALVFRRIPGKNGVMARSTQQLEARLAKVEKELAELKAALRNGDRSQPWYRQIVGDFAGDKAYAEIVRLGGLIRRGRLKA